MSLSATPPSPASASARRYRRLSRRLRDLVGEHLRRPRVVGEQLMLERDDVHQVRGDHRAQPGSPAWVRRLVAGCRLAATPARHHGVTRLGAPGLTGVWPPQVKRLRREQLVVRIPGGKGRYRDPAQRRGRGEGRAEAVGQHLGVKHRSLAGRPQPGYGDQRGLGDRWAGDPPRGGVIARPVELPPSRVRGHEKFFAVGIHVRGDGVEGAQAVYRDAKRGTEHPRGHQPDPQAGVRAGAYPDRDARQVMLRRARVGDDLGDDRREQLRMAMRVNRDELGQRLAAVMQRHSNRRRCGVQTEQQHDQ